MNQQTKRSEAGVGGRTGRVLVWLAGMSLVVGACRVKGGEQSPPQQLPIEAQWCLPGAPRRCIDLEVPSTPRQYSMGLQLRPALPPLRGMWFVFSPPSVAKFWMHRTLAPLDLLFIANNRIVAIEANAPICPHLPCPSYGPDEPVDGVVELGAGEAERLGLKVGSPVEIRWLPQPATPSKSKRD
ncbi:MAG: DUF192 domain-containing protein [Cyanobacteriota bacterium]|nr:DUF192 domain-containing protein [Cyanobacteriota bacterium]